MPAASSRRWKAWRRCSAPIPRPERSSPSVRRVPAMLRRRSAGTLVRRARPLQVQYRETSAAAVISDVASGTANLGVVRWQAEHAATLDNLLRENALSGEVLWEFSMVVLLHERHPLAALGDIPYHLLGDYPEIVHGDLTPVLPAEQPAQAAGGRQGRIAVFDRGGQFDILRNVPGSYMWVSPVPFEILAQQELVQKPCRSASRYRDVLVRRRPGALSAAEVAFINELRREIAGLVQT